jgi:hypothetical protein
VRAPKIILGIWLLIFSLAINGCTLFPSTNKTRPAPTRPKMTSPAKKAPNVRPAPTKRIPGASTATEKDILGRLTKVEDSLKKNDWTAANRETNTLGADMGRFRPTASKGKSLRETANFSVMYSKLQVDIKAKNKTAAMKDIISIRDAMKGVK